MVGGGSTGDAQLQRHVISLCHTKACHKPMSHAHKPMSHEQHIGVLPNFNVSGNSNLQSVCSHRQGHPQGHPQELEASWRVLTCDRRDARCAASKCVEMRHRSGHRTREAERDIPFSLASRHHFFWSNRKVGWRPKFLDSHLFRCFVLIGISLSSDSATNTQSRRRVGMTPCLSRRRVAELHQYTQSSTCDEYTQSSTCQDSFSLLINPGPSSPVRTSAMALVPNARVPRAKVVYVGEMPSARRCEEQQVCRLRRLQGLSRACSRH